VKGVAHHQFQMKPAATQSRVLTSVSALLLSSRADRFDGFFPIALLI
jgi:hypothetical protein